MTLSDWGSPTQDLDKNRQQDRHRERKQETAGRTAVDANATTGQRPRAKRIMRSHSTVSPTGPTSKRHLAPDGG